jgi:peptidoglycan/xylan/chitin deacetylase (PgdA/CDA1 family)
VTTLVRAPLTVCAQAPAPPNAARTVEYPGLIHELLGHYGIGYEGVAPEHLADALAETGVLLTVGEVVPDEDDARALREWVEAGGAWIAMAGVCGAADVLGIEIEAASFSGWDGGKGTLGEGYLERTADSPTLGSIARPLHYFGGVPCRATESRPLAVALDAHGHRTERHLCGERQVGDGSVFWLAVDVTGTMVRIRQGSGVLRDGVPSSDGTAPTTDGVLKSDDGLALDWLLDRSEVPGVPGLSAFLHPVADQWAELLVRAILRMARGRGVSVPVLWLYPRDLPAIGHLSHDTDGDDPACAEQLLAVLSELDVHSSWCVLPAAYPEETVQAIRRGGHDLGMHYDALADDVWGEGTFREQHAMLTRALGAPPTTNKNHYLRWEGDTDFWKWCARAGVTVDQSKGASKTGAAGFCFGTCHPYRPVTRDGAVLDVLELPTPTQDLVVFAPRALLQPLLEATLASYGVLHLLFHPAHVAKSGVADAIREAVRAGREAGLEWWTAAEIAQWERARRAARWTFRLGADGAPTATLTAEHGIPDGRLLLPGPGDVTRWGCAFRCVPVDLGPGESVEVGLGVSHGPRSGGDAS